MLLQSGEKKENQGNSQMFGRIAVRILQVCLLLVAFFLAYEGIRYSYYSSKAYDQTIFELPDAAVIHLVVFAGVCLVTMLLVLFLKKSRPGGSPLDQERLCRWFLFLTGLLVTVLGFFYLREHPYYPGGDQLNTTAAAAYARHGNFSMFANGGYIGFYEQQKGLVFLYEILFTLFGDYSYHVAAYFHLSFSMITLTAGYAFLKIVAKKPLYRILYCVMMLLCMPYMIYLPYIYGDLPSICFSTVLFWALAAYGQKLQKRYVAIGAFAAALALLVRMNIWIVLIAVGIGMVLLSLEKGNLRPILAGMCILLAAWGAVKAVSVMYEYRSGYESGVGIPSILWIAMGLQETDGNPGIYNRYQQSVFEDCNLDREAASRVGKEYIAERLEEFSEEPAEALQFFVKKLKMQWLEPLFEGLYATNHFKKGDTLPDWVVGLYYGNLHDIVWKSSNYYQSVIYLAFFAFAAGSLIRRKTQLTNSAGWIPLIAVVGGFLFSIIWENQCRYVLPYYVYLVMYAPIGIGTLAEWAGSLSLSVLKKDEKGIAEEKAA